MKDENKTILKFITETNYGTSGEWKVKDIRYTYDEITTPPETTFTKGTFKLGSITPSPWIDGPLDSPEYIFPPTTTGTIPFEITTFPPLTGQIDSPPSLSEDIKTMKQEIESIKTSVAILEDGLCTQSRLLEKILDILKKD